MKHRKIAKIACIINALMYVVLFLVWLVYALFFMDPSSDPEGSALLVPLIVCFALGVVIFSAFGCFAYKLKGYWFAIINLVACHNLLWIPGIVTGIIILIAKIRESKEELT